MLSTDQYVHVFLFDFTKAFDTIRNETLMNKMAQLNIPDNMYNWVKAFFEQHFHCTRYTGECSTVAAMKASAIQGSGLGPASFIVTAADLHPTTPGNRILKFTDDTYLVVPAANSSSRLGEVSNVEAWASRNNLKLNRTKSKELIFIREKCGQSSQPLPQCPDIERVSCAKVLGITLNDRLSATDHVNNLLTSCSSLLYVMRVLRGHGISTESLHDVFRSTILAKITYCLPAWSGLCPASDRAKLDSFLNRCKRLGFCDNSIPIISDILVMLMTHYLKRF